MGWGWWQVLQQQARAEQAAQASLAVRREERSAKLEAARRAEEKERRALRATQVAHPAMVAWLTCKHDVRYARIRYVWRTN